MSGPEREGQLVPGLEPHAFTRPGEGRTDGERGTVDQGSKEARLAGGQEEEDEGRVQDTAQGLCTYCFPLPGGLLREVPLAYPG